MRSVIDGGTGSRMRFRYNITAPMGGKTGTTNDMADGWFMSFTPNLVTGTWVGGEDRDIHFDYMSDGQGASIALPVAGLFYQKVFADASLQREGYVQTLDFEYPEVEDDYTDEVIIATTPAEEVVEEAIEGIFE